MIKCPNCKNSIFKIGIIHSESTVNYVDNDFTFEPTENSMNSKIIECTNCQTRYDLSDKEIANRLINPTETWYLSDINAYCLTYFPSSSLVGK